MRMRRKRIQTIHLFNRESKKDSEGVLEISYINKTPFQSEIWQASGKLQVKTYGDRVNNIFNVKIKGKYEMVSKDHHQEYVFNAFTLSEGDAVALFSDEPDFKVISIKAYNPLLIEVERI